MDFNVIRRQKLLLLYDRPVTFWEAVLGPELHFHTGHFSTPDAPIEIAQRDAVANLAGALPISRPKRVLDLGCGWGGPAFQLARLWDSEVVGVTISPTQAQFVNSRSARLGLSIRAIEADLETDGLKHLGRFDVVWLYEVLEHIANRRRLLTDLHAVAHDNTYLALSTACRAAEVDRSAFEHDQSGTLDYLAIQPLDTTEELLALLEQSGWKPVSMTDYTERTLPTWTKKLEKVRSIDSGYEEEAEHLAKALATTGQYFMRGKLRSVQIVAAIGRLQN